MMTQPTTIEHVAAGQLKAAQEQNHIYQAYLGTCVGVALYDRQAGIGGMIHILLPEPPGFSSAEEFPEKYAATGLPMLIEKMQQLGAIAPNIRATIAGGALVGPVSHQDINLDIGGRSVDVATSILETAGIKVIKSETGGFFTCTLELDLSNGETRIKPAWQETKQPEEKFKAPSIEDILGTIGKLKPIPQAALKILRMFNSPHHHIDDITNELAKDQVLSAQTLKLCNSALFAGMVKIDTLKEAVLLMGEDMLVKTIITAAVNTYYNQAGDSGYSLCRGGLFFHAVGVATTAERIATKCKSPYVKIAYTAGLLHDIGKVILDQSVANQFPLFFRRMSQEDMNFIDAEKKVLGITHCEAGALLAKKWQFSKALSETIRHHHHPEAAATDKDLAHIVNLADHIIEKFSVGFDVEKMPSDGLLKALQKCNLPTENLTELVDLIPLNLFEKSTI